MIFFDPVYLLIVGPTILLALWAQLRVKRAYRRWVSIPNRAGMTGAQAARAMLNQQGLDLRIETSRGQLSDHYDPRDRTLRLSPDVYSGRSVAALGIACHEAGHALQHAERYPLLQLRSSVVPFANIGSWLAWPLIILGAILGSLKLAMVGVVAFSALVLFQLVTLPVEFDASRRAKEQLAVMGIVHTDGEARGVASVLNAAALTYVAATATALAQLFYFMLRLGLVGGSSQD